VVADALSRKAHCYHLSTYAWKPELKEEIERLNLQVVAEGCINTMIVQPTLEEQIKEAQQDDEEIQKLKAKTGEDKASEFRIDAQGTLWYQNRICVPEKEELRRLILDEAHTSAYSIHPGSTKMYQDLKTKYWWNGMKRDIAEYIARCDTCQRVKAEHQKPAGLLQPLPIPVWKWDEISMDFIVGLPRTQKGNDSIWVIVDRLTKVAHFIPVKTTYRGDKYAQLYVDHILRLHGVPRRIVSDRGPQFTSRFWKSLQALLGTKLDFSSAYHPQTDGQTERVNQILEDMLRACVLTYGKDWEKSLSFAEFSYNNSYQASLQMAPFEALYGRKCRTPLMWSEVGERSLFGPAIIKEAEEQVAQVREKLKAAQSRQKSYADNRRRDLEFQEGDYVYLKVAPIRGTRRFQIRGKLTPRYIGPFMTNKKVGAVAYRLELPPEMSDIHNVFHVSQLKKCLRLPEEQVPLEVMDLQPDLQYQERPIRILDTASRKTRT